MVVVLLMAPEDLLWVVERRDFVILILVDLDITDELICRTLASDELVLVWIMVPLPLLKIGQSFWM